MGPLNHWWRADEYTDDTDIPHSITEHAGPSGVAIVRSWNDGKTDKGWGLKPTETTPGFMPLYEAGKFDPKRALPTYRKGQHNFAFVMRSLSLVCIDIDGKNDGFIGINRLGMMEPTLSETSKSGNGFHLFYRVPDTWDSELGFDKYADKIGLEQGVDMRYVGCVYHTLTQRWNNRPVADIPPYLEKRLDTAAQKFSAAKDRIATIRNTAEEHEILMMHTELIDDLAKPIPAGRRNNTLFAIGSKMMEAGIEGWDNLLEIRAKEVGLDYAETSKLVANIKAYA